MEAHRDGQGDDHVDDEIKLVKANVIVDKTRAIYMGGIARYVAWLFQNKRNLLTRSFLNTIMQTDRIQLNDGYETLQTKCVVRFMESNPDIELINYELHTPADFEHFILSLSRQDGSALGLSVYGSMRSSLFHLYRAYGRTVPPDFQADLTVFFKGLKPRLARRHHDDGVKLTEGKDPLPFSVYRVLAIEMMMEQHAEFGFAHAFLVISWNLMCRAGNTASIRLGHITWEEDSLAIRFGHMKNDQEGTRPRDARHVYANPMMPEICPILSLAIYFAVWGLTDSKLFPGGNQYDRFAHMLRRIMAGESLSAKLRSRGSQASDIGTHSIRKGSSTYVSSCSNGGPSAASICIRAGWSLPGVQDSYIRYEAAGDMVVGRYVAGLTYDSPEFAMLPPFFPNADDDEEVQHALRMCFGDPPLNMRLVCLFLMASLTYHYDFLRRTLWAGHPLWANALCGDNETVGRLRPKVVCRIATDSDPIRPTGVPPHIHILRQIHFQKQEAKELTKLVRSLAPQVVQGVQEAFRTAEGAARAPLTSDALENVFLRVLQRYGMLQQMETTQVNPEVQQADDTNDGSVPVAERHPPSLYFQGSRFARAPPDFEVPSCSLVVAWEHWCCGNPSRSCGPYRFLDGKDVADKRKRKKLSHYRCMMMEIETKAKQKNEWRESPTIVEARAILHAVIDELPLGHTTERNRVRRRDQLNWSTALQLLRRTRRGSS